MPSRREAATVWVHQFEGDRLEDLARTVADRIFLKRTTTWYGAEDVGGPTDAVDLVRQAVSRCKGLGFSTNSGWATDVIRGWGDLTPSPASPDPQ